MKHILYIVGIFLLATACLDDENDYNYQKINSLDKYIVENIKYTYSCFQGDTLQFDPIPKMPMDTIFKQDLSFEWYIEEEVKGHERQFEFKADEIGIFNLLFVTIDNTTGLRFPYPVTIKVEGHGYKGWWILSKTNGDASMLSSVWSRVHQYIKMDNNGKPILDIYGNPLQIDTILYEGKSINFVKGLGHGPIKLVENFAFNQYTYEGLDFSDDEMMVLQKDQCVELDGVNYKPVAYAKNEFLDGTPTNFEPTNAVLSYGCKCLLNSNGHCYFSVNSVATDLHTGRYFNDPAFNGRQIAAIYATNKSAARNKSNFFLALDKKTNSLIGIIDNGSVNSKSPIIDIQKNFTGEVIPVTNNKKPNFALFNEIKYEVIWTMWTSAKMWKSNSSNPTWVSILRDKDTDEYFLHCFQLDYNEYASTKALQIKNSFLKPINKEMFAGGDYKITRFQHKNYLIVANGDKMWLCNYNKENKDKGVYFAYFKGEEVVSLAAKDVNSTKYGGPHMGVGFKNGRFCVFEVIFNESMNTRTLIPLYNQDGFGDIVDVTFKHGSVSNLGTSTLF
ncbi:MAG: PKD-like family lipoprotein [Odoribacter sp.]